MNKKKKIIIVICIVVVFLGGIGFFSCSILKDQKETTKVMDKVLSDYVKFEKSVLQFNEIRDTIYNSILVETYYDTIKEKYDDFNHSFSQYEEIVDRVIANSKGLKNYCNGTYYSKLEVNQKCSSFQSLYEEVVNSFVGDVSSYNKVLDSYNEYASENNDTNVLKHYETSKKYIDFNHDKKYEGKE